MARVSHPALATIYGVETWRYTPILLVELLEGGTLAARLRGGQVLEWPAVVDLGLRVARGLGALHGAGLLHRDVKPSNIGFTAGGEPKLLDLGIAELFEAMADGTAQDRRLAGTLAYLPPEAFRGEPPGPLFDVWGLSVTLVEAAIGVHPFHQRLEQAASPDEALGALRAPSMPRGTPPRVKDFSEAALGLTGGSRPQSAADLEVLLGAC
jgi:serine/threonine protein kinase